MLAYELFYNNKNSKANNPKSQFLIKKVFYKNNHVAIDQKTLEEYGSEVTESTKQVQNWLQMPLNTINIDDLNMPDFRTGAASANPYIEVYGFVKTNKSGETKLSLSIGKKSNQIDYTLDLTTGKIQKKSEGKVTLKLDNVHYFINSNTLFSEYVNSGIIDNKGILNAKEYQKIVQKFLEFANKNYDPHNITKIGNTSFRIYILPDDSLIEFKNKTKKNDTVKDSFIDYFGNKVLAYASTSTKTAKFLSFDDPAFTINCTKGESFYKNVGIGDTSLEKIYANPAQTFKINRLDWTFADISNPNSKFVETKKGILTQLYENYKQISKDKSTRAKAQLKVICIRINQAKQELLINENLTMDTLEKMFSNMDDIPPLCLEEVLIDKSNKNPIWDVYLYVVRNFLVGNKTPQNYLLLFFSKILKQKRYDWIKLKSNSEQKSFFLRTEFCFKYLSTSHNTKLDMQKNEEFAEKIGQISRVYIDFKQKNGETENSLSDILTYSKYDRERLRFIVSRIGRGVQLSKVSDDAKKAVTEKISSLQPSEEITDEDASKDYSYFFFKGYYSNREIPA